MKKTAGGVTTVYHHDQRGKLLSETDVNGNRTADYVYVNGKLAAKVDNTGAVSYYHVDLAGTPTAMTDSSGNVIWRAEYLPFGEEQLLVNAKVNDKMFVGKEKDEETGLYYFGARYLQDRNARFVRVDPVGPVDPASSKTNEKMLLNPQMLNRYAYALNNPYRYVDPDGREVTIVIQRDKYTDTSVTGNIRVSSNVTNSTFNGYTLENAHAGDKHDKTPIRPGTYDASVRTDHDPNRVELKDVDGYNNIQIHEGNIAKNVKGCFAAGTTRDKDYVGNSQNAMGQINNIIRKDGSNNIRVIVTGPSTEPIK